MYAVLKTFLILSKLRQRPEICAFLIFVITAVDTLYYLKQ